MIGVVRRGGFRRMLEGRNVSDLPAADGDELIEKVRLYGES